MAGGKVPARAQREKRDRDAGDNLPLLAGDEATPKVFPKKRSCCGCGCIALALFFLSVLLFAASIGLYFGTICGASKGVAVETPGAMGTQFCPHVTKAQEVLSAWKTKAVETAGKMKDKFNENLNKLNEQVDKLKKQIAAQKAAESASSDDDSGPEVADVIAVGVVDGIDVTKEDNRVEQATQAAPSLDSAPEAQAANPVPGSSSAATSASANSDPSSHMSSASSNSVQGSSAGAALPAASVGQSLTDTQLASARTRIGVSQQDAELFEMALSVGRSATSTPKVAFMFLTPGELPFAPLWARFFRGNENSTSIYVHAAPGFVLDPKTTPNFFRGTQIVSQALTLGTASVVDAQRRLLANALLDPSNQYFVLLSDRAIPLFPFRFVFNYLRLGDMSYVDSKHDNTWSKSFLPLIHQTNWLSGSQWFEISRPLAVAVLKDNQYYPKFHSTRITNGLPEEHYLQTLLGSIAPRQLANRTVMYTLADPTNPTAPQEFGPQDVTSKLINDIKGVRACSWRERAQFTCYLFAQNFHRGSLNRLLKLGEDLGY